MGLVSDRASRQAVVVVAMLLTAFFLAACGGSDESTADESSSPETTETGASDAPTKNEFIAEGDALCAAVQAESADLAQRAQEIDSQQGTLPDSEILARAEAVWGDQIRLIRAFRGDFRALGTPAGDEERVGQFIENLDDSLDVAQEIRATLAGGEEVPQTLVEEYGQTVVRGNTLAQAYGFQVCGQTD